MGAISGMRFLFFTGIICVLSACGGQGERYIPKPRGFARMVFPTPHYVRLADSFPYSFEHSAYAKVLEDSSWMSERYWLILYYPSYEASLQLTYKSVEGDKKRLREYLSDAYTLAFKHQSKAYSIQERTLDISGLHRATFTYLRGEVPTPFQFHITDSVSHFLRGALYFKVALKNDSLSPVVEYLHQDVLHLLQTLRWKD